MRAEINYLGKLEVQLFRNDICHLCRNTNNCPLIQAVLNETAILHYENTTVDKCGLFEQT